MSGGDLKREDWRQHLRDLAAKASPGPWSWDGDELVGTPDDGEFILHKVRESSWTTPVDADAAWIAAASPSVVVALLDDVERLEKELRDEQIAHENTVDQRDRAEEWADRLAYTIAPQSVIGEHSSGDNPWQNALDQI